MKRTPSLQFRLDKRGEEVYAAVTEVSEREVFWSETFKEGERRLFRKHLVIEEANFALRDTFQIVARRLCVPDAQLDPQHAGRTVVCLHDMEGQATSCWAWIKLAPALFRAGMSTILINWPGFGASRMNNEAYCKPESWLSSDWRVLGQMLEMLEVRDCLIVAHGRACSTVLRLAANQPHMIGKDIYFHNPTFLLDDVVRPEEPKPGAGSFGLARIRERQKNQLTHILRSGGHKVWATYYHPEGLLGAPKALQEGVQALQLSSGSKALPVAQVTEVSENHICEIRAGIQVPAHLLFLSRALRQHIVNFLQHSVWPGLEQLPDPSPGSEVSLSSALPSLTPSMASTPVGSQLLSPNMAAALARHVLGAEAREVAAPSLAGSTSLPSLRSAAFGSASRTSGGPTPRTPDHRLVRWQPRALEAGCQRREDAWRWRLASVGHLPTAIVQKVVHVDEVRKRLEEEFGTLDTAVLENGEGPERQLEMQDALDASVDLYAAVEDRRRRLDAFSQHCSSTGTRNNFMRRKLSMAFFT